MDPNAQTAEPPRSRFFENLPAGLSVSGDAVESRLLNEYGSVFIARNGVTVPMSIVFRDEEQVAAFQASVRATAEMIGGIEIELQAAAMDGLLRAAAEAESKGLTISPRGPDSGRRSYADTVGLWKSRVDPALKHWVAENRLSRADADRIASLSPFEQVPEVLKLEEEGIYFAKDLSKSIIYSVAPPGTSQHLSMLAFDVKEFENEKVRSILAKHRWYQTVVSDLPHFTYLGVGEEELPALGLKRFDSGGRIFWIPDI